MNQAILINKVNKTQSNIKLPQLKNIKDGKNAGWTSKQFDIYQPKEESAQSQCIGFQLLANKEQEILRNLSGQKNKFR